MGIPWAYAYPVFVNQPARVPPVLSDELHQMTLWIDSIHEPTLVSLRGQTTVGQRLDGSKRTFNP